MAQPPQQQGGMEDIVDRLIRIEAQMNRLTALASATTTNAPGASRGSDTDGSLSPASAALAPQPPSEGRRQRSSHFVEEGEGHGSPHGAKFRAKAVVEPAATSAASNGSDSPSGSAFSLGTAPRATKFATVAANANNQSPSTSATSSPRSSALEKQQSPAKGQRIAFFAEMNSTTDWKSIKKCPGVKCSWLCAAALGLTFAGDGAATVTLEDMLRANEMALHYVSMPSVTQAELSDVIKEYIRGHRDLKNKLACESVTFDTELLEDLDDNDADGVLSDRGPMQSLIAFRKAIATELTDDSRSLHIFNYDPFLVQEAEAKVLQDEDEDEDDAGVTSLDGSVDTSLNASLSQQAKKQVAQQWQAKNMGQFSILSQYNAALHTVTLLTPHLAPDGKSYTLEVHTCPLQTLFNACAVKDGYTKRPRGFVRIYTRPEKNPLSPQPQNAIAAQRSVKHKFPLSLVDGRDSRGMLSIALDISIAPHILGLGLLHGIVDSVIVPKERRVQQEGVDLRGIPVTDVCTRLGLPVGTIMGSSTRDSLATATAWYRKYLEAVKLADVIDVGCVLVSRRDDAEDGAVNHDEEDVIAFFRDTMKCPTAVVLVAFNVNLARGVKVVPDGQSPIHFAILLGMEGRVVALADVSVKKFGAVWHTTTERLFRSIVGNGFLVATETGNDLAKRFDGAALAEEMAVLARYNLPRRPVPSKPGTLATRRLSSFEHPHRNYSVTVLAKGLNALLPDRVVTVEDLIYRSGFHVSFMLSEHLPLLATERIANYYCHHFLNDSAHAVATVADTKKPSDVAAFIALIQAALEPAEPDTVVLVNYAGASLNQFPLSWNGSFGGNLALVVGYDKEQELVYLEDSNPDSYYRQWAIRAESLCSLLAATDSIADRARGYIVLRRGAHPLLPAQARRLDMRRAQLHHPFKNPVSSVASAIAFALSESLPGSAVASEEVIYASSAFSLGTINNESNVDLALRMVHDWVAQHPSYKGKITVTAVASGEGDLVAHLAPQGTTRLSVVLFKPSLVFEGLGDAAAVAGGVVAHASEEAVVVCDGSPTRHGEIWSRPAAALKSAVVGVLHFTAAV